MYKMVLIKNQTNKSIEIKQNSTWTVRAIDSTDEFVVQKNLPLMNQLDFVKNMISLYNLFFYVDEPKKLIIFEP